MRFLNELTAPMMLTDPGLRPDATKALLHWQRMRSRWSIMLRYGMRLRPPSEPMLYSIVLGAVVYANAWWIRLRRYLGRMTGRVHAFDRVTI